MSLRRLGWLLAIAVAAWLELSCGEVYRPVVIPTNVTPPDPANFHAVFGISSNVSSNPGSALQIDVSGDTDIGAATMGVNPTHATILPNNSRVFVANAGSLFTGDADTVMAFTPASQSSTATGLGTPTVFSLPYGSLPVFLNTAQAGAVFVANYGSNTVSSLNTASNVVSLTGAVGLHPVALAETPNTLNLYVANQGDGTVTDLSPADLSKLAPDIPVGVTPVWVLARKDGARVYVLTQGGGQLVAIDTASNTVLPSQTNLSVGSGANFLLYDPHLNRLYVTNPSTGVVYVFSATGGVDSGGTANDTPTLLAAIDMKTVTNAPCPNGCSPVSVAALPDGSRFYVASYQNQSPCQDVNVGGGACVIPMLTVFDARSLAVKAISDALAATAPSLSLLTPPQFASGQYALPPAASCLTPATYAPGATRFRMFATAAPDSSHVYVSICDAGTIADINTTTSPLATGGTNSVDQLVTNLVSPFATCGATCSTVATITGFSITSNVVTFTAANNFFAGEKVSITGLTTGTYLNGKTLTVLATGLSSGSFACNFTNADVSQTADSGTAVPSTPPQTPIFLLTGQ
jgi:YVTN family beta-propeller protein